MFIGTFQHNAMERGRLCCNLGVFLRHIEAVNMRVRCVRMWHTLLSKQTLEKHRTVVLFGCGLLPNRFEGPRCQPKSMTTVLTSLLLLRARPWFPYDYGPHAVFYCHKVGSSTWWFMGGDVRGIDLDDRLLFHSSTCHIEGLAHIILRQSKIK